jgi:hypothetical protein
MSSARIYPELAEYLRGRGYPGVTLWVVHDWRRRGLLPGMRGLRRSRRPSGRIPPVLKARALAIARYRYEFRIRDLRMVTLLLWLDREPIPLDKVRASAAELTQIVGRFVQMSGTKALKAYPDDSEADLDAAALAVTRLDLPSAVGGEQVHQETLRVAAFDALAYTLGRAGLPEPGDIAPLAIALGLGRAATETVYGEGPWLSEEPGAALLEALTAVFGDTARDEVVGATDADLLNARSLVDALLPRAMAFGALFRLAFPKGTAGLGPLTLAIDEPHLFRALLLVLAIIKPADARAFADGLSEEQVAEARAATTLGRRWLDEHPEYEEAARTLGLDQVLRGLDG